MFLLISTDFTPTLGIPATSHILKFASLECSAMVEPQHFTIYLTNRLRISLRPVIPDNARIFRLTAAAGTELADPYS